MPPLKSPSINRCCRARASIPASGGLTGSTYDNPALSPEAVARFVASREGSPTARSEIWGELTFDVAGALFSRELIDACQIAADDVPPLAKFILAIHRSLREQEGRRVRHRRVGPGQGRNHLCARRLH